MDYLPLFLDVRDRTVAVVGGGEVAQRKAKLLHGAGARLRVIAPRFEAGFERWLLQQRAEVRREAFTAAALDGAALAIAATDDAAVNRAVFVAGRARNIFVNVVDDGSAGDCLMPAIVDRSPLIVAIGTGGGSPTVARRVRTQLEALLPQSLGALVTAAARWRVRVKEVLPDMAQRRRFWERWFDQAAAAGLASDAAALDGQLQRALAAADGAGAPRGEVWLIGAGPGDPDLLTLRAQQLLQQCDVLLYDRLVSSEVLDRVRRDAERIYVGKESGRHRITQQRIHELLLEHAARGLRVARLKGGDPFVFGRGGEEIEALAAAGIPVTVVPGVTAALGAAAVAGIPLTHRAVAQSVTFVTAMGEAAEQLDWRALAAPLQTTVFYMGVAQLSRIVARLREHGAPADRAVAIVERATLPGQRIVTGTLDNIDARAQSAGVSAPALLIVGEVAAHRQELRQG